MANQFWHGFNQLLAIKESGDIVVNLIRFFLTWKGGNEKKAVETVASSKQNGSDPDSSGNVRDNDDFFYLVALSGAWMESLSQTERNGLRFDAERLGKLNRIYEIMRERGQVGATEKLMGLIGKEADIYVPKTQKKRQVQGRNQQAGQQPPLQEEVIQEGKPYRYNASGQAIVFFLTSLTPEQAVEHLNLSSINTNAKDKMAATAKAANDAVGERWEALKKWWYDGDRDLRIHSRLATFILDDKEAMQEILASERALVLWNSYQLEANNSEQARVYIEELEDYIWAEVEARQKRGQSTEPQTGESTASNRPRKKQLSKMTLWMIVIWGTAGIFTILTILIQILKSLGT